MEPNNWNLYSFIFYVEYAQVTKMLGNGRLEAMCFDGVKRLCHIRGKLRKKVWINQGDIILIGLRDYQDAKADVILKYTSDEARNLKTYGEFPETGKQSRFISVKEGRKKVYFCVFLNASNVIYLILMRILLQSASTIQSPSLKTVSMKISSLVMKLVTMMKMMLTMWILQISIRDCFNNL